MSSGNESGNKAFLVGRPASFAMSCMVDGKDKRMNNNAAAGYPGPVKTELLKGARLLFLALLVKSQN